jgi:hypothetical protein
MVNTVIIAPIPSRLSSYWWNHLISSIKVTIAPIAPVSGQGRLFIIWNGWFSCIDINWRQAVSTQKSAMKNHVCEKLDKKNLPTTIEVKMFVDANSPVGYIYGKGNTF